ncbi:hypothetical protein, partial [Micrococcus sp. F3Y]|uniref:hypothetical protein n=1 Tax=Micrococcus sp. F3Y TaxID=3402627 RepID=UPI003AF558D7
DGGRQDPREEHGNGDPHRGLPAAVGLTAGASALPGPPSTGPMSAALIAVMAIGAGATLSSWRALAATFGRRPRRHRPTTETT